MEGRSQGPGPRVLSAAGGGEGPLVGSRRSRSSRAGCLAHPHAEHDATRGQPRAALSAGPDRARLCLYTRMYIHICIRRRSQGPRADGSRRRAIHSWGSRISRPARLRLLGWLLADGVGPHRVRVVLAGGVRARFVQFAATDAAPAGRCVADGGVVGWLTSSSPRW
eukprot:scaffold7416_cov390-Prasinococcus_capsulatus_cf.AAC.3